MLQQMWQDSIPLPDDHEFYTWGNWQPGRLRQCHDNATINDGAKDIPLKDHIVMQLHSKDGEVTDLAVLYRVLWACTNISAATLCPAWLSTWHSQLWGCHRWRTNCIVSHSTWSLCILSKSHHPCKRWSTLSAHHLDMLSNTRHALWRFCCMMTWLSGWAKVLMTKASQMIPMRIDPANALGFDDEMFNECFNPLNEWLATINPLTPLNAKDSTPACKVNFTDGYGRWTLDGMVEHLFLIYGTDNAQDNLNQTRMRLCIASCRWQQWRL